MIEFTREGQPAIVKGKLESVEKLESGKILLRVSNLIDSEKNNIVAEDNIKSYFARPLKEEVKNERRERF